MNLKTTPEYAKKKDTDRDRAIWLARTLEIELNAALETIETQREHIAELKCQTVAAMPNPKLNGG